MDTPDASNKVHSTWVLNNILNYCYCQSKQNVALIILQNINTTISNLAVPEILLHILVVLSAIQILDSGVFIIHGIHCVGVNMLNISGTRWNVKVGAMKTRIIPDT